MKHAAQVFGAALAALAAAQFIPPAPAQAEEAAPERFRLTRTTTKIPERGAVALLVLETARDRFSFMPPAGWSARLDGAARKVTFDAQRGLALVTVHLSTNPAVVAWDGDALPSRDHVASRWPGSTVTEEFAQPAGLGLGRAFVLRATSTRNDPWITRVVVVPMRHGVLELALSAPASEFNRHVHGFGNLVNTMKLEPPSLAATRP
jgi:hypothetical protein